MIFVNVDIVRTLIIIDYSSIIISLVNSKKTIFDGKLASLIVRIQKDIYQFQEVTSYQVLRTLNHGLANEATNLNEGMPRENGGIYCSSHALSSFVFYQT